MSSSDKVAYILVGIPGSGKSTVRNSIENVTVISSDDFIEGHAKEQGKTYNEVFKDVVGVAQRHCTVLFEQVIESGENFIWDQTNITSEKRRSILAKIPSDYKKVALYLDTPLEVAIERNAKRERNIPEGVIRDMHSRLEPPTTEEGFDSVIHYVTKKE